MKGLELSEAFYEEYGKPMLERDFPHLLPHLAVAFCGAGSECLGFDDACSRDHDFEPGFTVFLPDEDRVSRRDAFLLERAYAKLPTSFKDYARSMMSPVGGNRFGVVRMADFFLEKTGVRDGRIDRSAWLRIPEQSLLEATNGKIFYDGPGEFTKIRAFLSEMPDEARFKRLAGELVRMGQSGAYNYARCLSHGEEGAAQLALSEYALAVLHCIFLLGKQYMPYYKWAFRAAQEFLQKSPDSPLFGVPEMLEPLILRGNSAQDAEKKKETMREIEEKILNALAAEGLCEQASDLGQAAYQVNDRISDGEIRNLHILYSV